MDHLAIVELCGFRTPVEELQMQFREGLKLWERALLHSPPHPQPLSHLSFSIPYFSDWKSHPSSSTKQILRVSHDTCYFLTSTPNPPPSTDRYLLNGFLNHLFLPSFSASSIPTYYLPTWSSVMSLNANHLPICKMFTNVLSLCPLSSLLS